MNQINFIDIDMAALSVCPVEPICRADFCCLHQNRFAGRSLCYIDDIAFVVAVVVIAALVAVDLSVLGNHVVFLCLHLMVSFYLLFR